MGNEFPTSQDRRDGPQPMSVINIEDISRLRWCVLREGSIVEYPVAFAHQWEDGRIVAGSPNGGAKAVVEFDSFGKSESGAYQLKRRENAKYYAIYTSGDLGICFDGLHGNHAGWADNGYSSLPQTRKRHPCADHYLKIESGEAPKLYQNKEKMNE